MIRRTTLKREGTANPIISEVTEIRRTLAELQRVTELVDSSVTFLLIKNNPTQTMLNIMTALENKIPSHGRGDSTVTYAIVKITEDWSQDEG